MMAQMRELVTTYHLELMQPEALVPAAAARTPYRVERSTVPVPELNRFLYASVGADWRWYMRLEWSYDQWQRYLARDEVGTWIAYVEGTPAGYFELERQPPDSVEIAYFGLLPQFIGRGMGGAFLTDAVRTAFEFGSGGPDATRVWLHTCTLDHPAALANYQARGFRIFDTVALEEEVPDGPMDPWPGAGRVAGVPPT
jgi:ribosomal protein S18 acetylase RimI-like enzyme